MIVTEQEMIDSLKDELKKVLDIKNFCQKKAEELEAINESLRGEITHFNNLIESLYGILNLAGFSPPEN
jgi:FtsZ-binding cell division protein ZapB